MEQRTIIIGSRGSELALWQANFTQARLLEAGYKSEIKIIRTSGDNIQHLSFDKMEGKGFFTKEIEEALQKEEIDLAVHSHKDLETTNPPGLHIAAIPNRADVRDMLLIRKESHQQEKNFGLSEKAVIGTSSARRKSQLIHHLPQITLKDLRGNVPTRIQKLRDGLYDAILLAKAGIDRLGLDLTDLICIPLDPSVFIPAPAQGALGLQIRESDEFLNTAMKSLHLEDLAISVEAERSVLREIHGGCQVPLGAYCEKAEGAYKLHVAYATTWDSEIHFFTESGADPMELSRSISAKIKLIANA